MGVRYAMGNATRTIRTALQTANAFGRARLLGRRVPYLVGWNLTFHCNLRCTYCYSPYLKYPEMKTEEILAVMEELHGLGTRFITFSGGEPLLRKDIGTIVAHAKYLGITVFISTNGFLLPKRIDDVALVDRLTISLDGGAEVHNKVRGAGAFEAAEAAIVLARERNIPVALTCVLSKENLDNVDEVLALASRHKSMVMFQPATLWLDSSDKPNPIAPDPEAYRRTIDYLLQLKAEGAPVTNSPAGLRVLRRWPEPTPIWSTAGLLSCTVEPDGKILASHLTQAGTLETVRRNGTSIREEFARAVPILQTDQPWCGPILELDLIFGGHPGAVWNALRMQA